MTVAIKSLEDGQLPISKGTLYTAPTSKQAIVKRITLVNTDSSARAINLYFKASGRTSRRITPKDYSLAVGALMVMDDELTMESADIIEGDAAAATVIDFVISGIENS